MRDADWTVCRRPVCALVRLGMCQVLSPLSLTC